jgi:hypothetical protein
LCKVVVRGFSDQPGDSPEIGRDWPDKRPLLRCVSLLWTDTGAALTPIIGSDFAAGSARSD